MNWEAVGAIGEVIGAIAVLVTLMYLASQVRSARKAAVASIIQGRGELAYSFFRDNETSVLPADTTPDQAEEVALSQQFWRTIAYNHTLWAQRELGVIEPKYYVDPANVVRLAFAMNPDSSKSLWHSGKASYSPEFIAWVESIIQEVESHRDT